MKTCLQPFVRRLRNTAPFVESRPNFPKSARVWRTLTPREREVLEYVVAGKLNKQIAGDLGTVEQTVKIHRAHVMQKMRVQSVAELVRLTERCGIGGAVD